MSGRGWWILLSLLIGANVARAQSSCLPMYTAAQDLVAVDPNVSGVQFKSALFSERADGLFPTKVQVEGQMTDEKDPHFALKVRFDPAFGGVSIPYNLYAVMIVKDGDPILWMDFTKGCKGTGISFFPGAIIDAGRVKLPAGGASKLQIMVWGRM